MFENVNIDWHISQDDGSTDFSDDETLDDPSSSRLNGTRTPERSQNISPNKSRSGLRPLSTVAVLPTTPTAISPPINNNNNNNNAKSDWVLDRTPGSDWSRSTPSDSNSGGSPGSFRIMPPPPPPQSKKPPMCKSLVPTKPFAVYLKSFRLGGYFRLWSNQGIKLSWVLDEKYPW